MATNRRLRGILNPPRTFTTRTYIKAGLPEVTKFQTPVPEELQHLAEAAAKELSVK